MSYLLIDNRWMVYECLKMGAPDDACNGERDNTQNELLVYYPTSLTSDMVTILSLSSSSSVLILVSSYNDENKIR